MTMPATDPSLPVFDHGSRRPRVVREILVNFFTGKFKAGQRMRVESLAQQFEVSATPVREALVELAGVGIVELQPNRGAVLRQFGPEEVREMVQVRRLLECEAVRMVCEQTLPDEFAAIEQSLVELLERQRDDDWANQTRLVDMQLHHLIAQHCGSQRLAHEIGRYAILSSALRDARHARRRALANFSHMEENAEHLEIVRKIAAHDAPAAVAAMDYHINQAKQILINDLFTEGATVAETGSE